MPTQIMFFIGGVVLVILFLKATIFKKSPTPFQYTPQKQGIGPGTWFLIIVAIVLTVYESPWLLSHFPLSTSPIRIQFVSPSATPSPVKGSRQYYIDLARKDATSAGINPGLFVRQMDLESAWNPDAVSPKGAIGIAQFMPATAKALGINPRNPEQSLAGAARLMASYIKLYRGDYAMALAAYNAGSGMVLSAIVQAQKYGGTWDHYLPTETQRYIHLILGY